MLMHYYEELLEILEICLKHNLKNDYQSNTPHGNIVSDIFSCILLVCNILKKTEVRSQINALFFFTGFY